jgi:hypothetical protein
VRLRRDLNRFCGSDHFAGPSMLGGMFVLPGFCGNGIAQALGKNLAKIVAEDLKPDSSNRA